MYGFKILNEKYFEPYTPQSVHFTNFYFFVCDLWYLWIVMS